MRSSGVLRRLWAFAVLLPAASHPAESPLQALSFLLGEWHAPAPSQAGDVFRWDLGGQVLIRVAQSEAAHGRDTATMHTSMTIYDEPGRGLRAIYFDDGGHVIHYRLSAIAAARSVQFLSEPGDRGPRFRLTYLVSAPDQLRVRFEMAAPGKPVQYHVIAEGSETRAEH